MKSQLGAGDHERIAHVIAGVAHIDQLQSFQPAEVLPDRQHIRQHLSRMILVCQPIPYRNSRIPGQFLHDLLSEAPVFDAVIHPSQHPCRVLDALFLAHLGTCRPKISCTHSHIMSCHFKGTAGAGAVLLKDQGDIFPPPVIHRDPPLLFLLHIRRQIEQVCDLLRCKVLQCQKVSPC